MKFGAVVGGEGEELGVVSVPGTLAQPGNTTVPAPALALHQLPSMASWGRLGGVPAVVVATPARVGWPCSLLGAATLPGGFQ